MRAERPILLRFLNVLTSLNDFIIKTIGFLFLVKYFNHCNDLALNGSLIGNKHICICIRICI